MNEVRDSVFARAVGIDHHLMAIRVRPLIIRNSRVLVGLAIAGSIAAFPISLCLVAESCLNVFTTPAGRDTSDRFAVAFLCATAAWLMGATSVYLWRLGRLMGESFVRLDSHGAHFKLDTIKDRGETFLAWDEIAAVQYKRIGGEQKVIVLGSGDISAIFNSNTFYRPRKVAQLIADRAGLPVLRG